MSELGFGFLRLPLKDSDKPGSYDWDLLCDMTDLFMDMGGSYFDTCYTYLDGASEEGIRRCVTERKPRNSFRLAEKIPGYECKSYEDCQKFFDKECERCGTDYFDVLMLHWLNRENYAIAEAQDQFRFLEEKKKDGGAVLTGFSYHDDAELLDEILTAHPEVDVVLSGMSDLAQVRSNMEAAEALTSQEKKILMQAAGIIKSDVKVQCTACGYCRPHCARDIYIPEMFRMYNEISRHPEEDWKLKPLYDKLADMGKSASDCAGCRACEEHCPQGIKISEHMKEIEEKFRQK